MSTAGLHEYPAITTAAMSREKNIRFRYMVSSWEAAIKI